MAKKTKTFQVWAKVTVDTSLPVSAESLEEALTKARELRTLDFVEIYGEHNDSDVEITGVMV